ncbi:hypothetical protein QA811_43240 [Streptomyces sp. B21-102]
MVEHAQRDPAGAVGVVEGGHGFDVVAETAAEGVQDDACEFSQWVEKRRELEAARVESSLEPPPDDDTSHTGGFTPLHKKRAPIPRQRPYGSRNRLLHRRREQIIS